MKWLTESADGADFYRFIKNLWAAMRADQHNRYLRLMLVNIFDHLKPGDVGQKKIYDTKTEAPLPRLIDSVNPFGHEHHLVAAGFEHKPERVAYGRFVIDDQNTNLVLC